MNLKAKKVSIFILILLLSVISTNCGEKYDSGKDLYMKDGLIFKNGENKPFTGKVKGKASNKTIQYEVKDGLKDGKFILYFANGNVELKGNMVKNKNEGEWSYYYSDNTLESRGDFKNDLADGKWEWYFHNGNLKEEGNYAEGEREGERQSFNDDGSLYIKRYFKDNVQIDSVMANKKI
jgi:antitoxin component YwqK of YwqJK toxin-antitoxin module